MILGAEALSPAAVYVAGGLVSLATIYALWLTILEKRRKLAEPAYDPRAETRIQQPLSVEEVKVFVQATDFEKQMLALEKRFEQRFVKLEQENDRRLTDMDAYLHRAHHESREQLNALTLLANERRESAVEEGRELRKEITEAAVRVHERVDTIINEMPGKIVALLRDTGALTKGGRA